MPVERITGISKAIDVGTVVGALVLAQMGLISPGLASAAIEFSIATYAGAEIVESEVKRHKNKSQ